MSSSKKSSSQNALFQPFENLKKIINTKGVRLHCESFTLEGNRSPDKNKNISDEEVFSDAMKQVREIKEFRSLAVRQRKVAPPGKKSHPDNEVLTAMREIIAGQRSYRLSDTQEFVEWKNIGYGGDVIRRLHGGKFSVQDCLDLHGLTVGESEEEVRLFLEEAVKRNYCCVKIIHGRGLRSPNGPVLKEPLIKWLSGRYRKHLAAFVTARPCDGGLGALYILLK